MALNKDVLGTDLDAALQQFQDKTPDQVGDMNAFRLAFCKVVAEQVINHIKALGEVNVTVNTTVATTGGPTAQSGTGIGTGVGKMT